MIRFDLKRVGKGSFKRFAQEMPASANWIASVIAQRFDEWVQRFYLSGQMLRERSYSERAAAAPAGVPVRRRSTKESTRFFKIRQGTFGIRPGSGVPGMMNYLAGRRFEGGERPFMQTAWKDFRKGRRHIQIAEQLMNRMLERENRRTRGAD